VRFRRSSRASASKSYRRRRRSRQNRIHRDPGCISTREGFRHGSESSRLRRAVGRENPSEDGRRRRRRGRSMRPGAVREMRPRRLREENGPMVFTAKASAKAAASSESTVSGETTTPKAPTCRGRRARAPCLPRRLRSRSCREGRRKPCTRCGRERRISSATACAASRDVCAWTPTSKPRCARCNANRRPRRLAAPVTRTRRVMDGAALAAGKSLRHPRRSRKRHRGIIATASSATARSRVAA
jgi:hypothetical protein